MSFEIDTADVSSVIVSLCRAPSSSEAKAQLDSQFGEATTTEAARIVEALMNCPVDWSKASMDSALDVLWATMKSDYAWLSDEAKTQINYAFIMAWK